MYVCMYVCMCMCMCMYACMHVWMNEWMTASSPAVRRFTVLRMLVKRHLGQQRETESDRKRHALYGHNKISLWRWPLGCWLLNVIPVHVCSVIRGLGLCVSCTCHTPSVHRPRDPHYSTVTMIFPQPVRHALAFITCTHGTLRQASPGGAMWQP